MHFYVERCDHVNVSVAIWSSKRESFFQKKTAFIHSGVQTYIQSP